MKFLFASIVIASLATAAAAADTQPANGTKPAAKSTKPISVKKVPAPTHRQAVEEATPTSEPDPRVKLNEAQLAIARIVDTGEIKCELGAKVSIKPMKREGFFFVSHGVSKFVMHPVESRTGAIRLEDPVRGALWMQLANKSMLLNQKEGKRLADECQSPKQVAYARNMKAVNLLEPASTRTTAPTGAGGNPASAP
jgi:hypothetical protein